jgi:transposase-like protein
MGGVGSGEHKFTPENVAALLKRIAEGATTKKAAEEIGVDVDTIANWRVKYPSFESEFTRAQDAGFDSQADELNEIAEKTSDVQRARLMCDNIKWRLARRAAHKYGDRLDINVTQTVDIGAALLEAKQRALPLSYQKDLGTAEIADAIEITSEQSTGSKSVDAPNPTETRDAPSSDSDDIFS